MNPIEKFWDALLARMNRKASDLNIGTEEGYRRPYTTSDFTADIKLTRMSLSSYHCVFEDRA
jgi:hypothetical protein